MIAVPTETPVTIPVEGETETTPVDELIQVPPEGVTPNEVDAPTHKLLEPEIADGRGLTVTVTTSISGNRV